MPIDKEKYRASLKALGLTRAQEDEIITALYAIMSAFVTAAFGKSEARLVRAEHLHNRFSQNGAGQAESFMPRSTGSIKNQRPHPPASFAEESVREG